MLLIYDPKETNHRGITMKKLWALLSPPHKEKIKNIKKPSLPKGKKNKTLHGRFLKYGEHAQLAKVDKAKMGPLTQRGRFQLVTSSLFF